MTVARVLNAFFCRAIVCLLLLHFLPFRAHSQEADTNQVNDYLSKIWPMHFRDIDSALNLSGYCYQQAMRTPNLTLRMRSLHMLGVIEQESGDYQHSIVHLDSAIMLAKRLNDEKRLGHLYNSIGMSYHLAGNYRLGMEYVLNSAKIKEKIGDVSGTITTYINIASLHMEQSDTNNALKYAQDAYDFCYKNKVTDYYPEVNDAMGRVLVYSGDTAKGRMYLLKALDYSTTAKQPLKSLSTLEQLTTLAIHKRDTAEARRYLVQFDEAARSANDRAHLPLLYFGYAQYYFLKGNLHSAEKFIRISIGLSESREKPRLLADMYQVYAKILRAENKTGETIEALERLSQLKDSINTIDKEEAARRISAEYENQKQEKEIHRLSEEKLANESEIRQKNLWMVIVIAGLLLISVLLFGVLRVYRRNRKNMVLLQLKNREIEIKNSIITNRNQDISDSINYARRIQDALLTDRNEVRSLFPESFILYKPKDILSGDFYWFAEKNGKKIMAAADCTGHGIPGALLSIACNSFLNDIINHDGITEPAKILSELRFLVIKSLKQTGAHGETKDGLDISLIVIDEQTRTVEFAGAKSPFCIVRFENGKPLLEKIDGDRRPVGYYLGRGLPFTNHTRTYQTGDRFYIFTDGYPDQFGGGVNKKYRRQTLLTLLESIAHLPMQEQEKALLEAHYEWRGDEEQTDDILVIGVQV